MLLVATAAVGNLGEGPGPPLFWVKRRGVKEEKPAEQVK